MWTAKFQGFVAKDERVAALGNIWQSVHKLCTQIDKDSMPKDNNYGKIPNEEMKEFEQWSRTIKLFSLTINSLHYFFILLKNVIWKYIDTMVYVISAIWYFTQIFPLFFPSLFCVLEKSLS